MKLKRTLGAAVAVVTLSLAFPASAAATESHSGSKHCSDLALATISTNTNTLGEPYGDYSTTHSYNGVAQYYTGFGSWQTWSQVTGGVSWYIYTNHSFNSYSIDCTGDIHRP